MNISDMLPGNPSSQERELIQKATNRYEATRRFGLGSFTLDCIHDEVAPGWLDRPKDCRDRAFGDLKGCTVVDIGCGRKPGDFQRMLGTYEPAQYVGIDLGCEVAEIDAEHSSVVGPYRVLDEESDGVNGVMVRGDALDLVSRIPEGQGVSYVLNGVDDLIINPMSPYGRALSRRMGATMACGSTVVGLTFAGGILTTIAAELDLVSERLDNFGTEPDIGFFRHTMS